jgi:hypothetical protein
MAKPLSVVMTVLFVACSSGPSGPVGGPVSGAADTHCISPDGGVIVQPTSAASCQLTSADAGPAQYGTTLYNAEGDDDDCKYHVKFTSTAVRENTDVNFTVVATQKADGGPASGAKVNAEVFLNDTHPAPNSNQHTTENPPGTFLLGPVRFDAKGQWTVRFHLHEECADVLPDSPHGHVAFYMDVP